jgi:hypothetical protein
MYVKLIINVDRKLLHNFEINGTRSTFKTKMLSFYMDLHDSVSYLLPELVGKAG